MAREEDILTALELLNFTLDETEGYYLEVYSRGDKYFVNLATPEFDQILVRDLPDYLAGLETALRIAQALMNRDLIVQIDDLRDEIHWISGQVHDRDLMILELQKEIEDLKSELNVARNISESAWLP